MRPSNQSGKKPHFSSSQLNMLSKCGEQWRRRYIENDKLPPVVSMLKGTAIHYGAELNFRQKIETRKDLSKENIVEIAVSKFESEFENQTSLSDTEASQGKNKLLHNMTQEVVDMAAVHAEEQAPDYQPLKVEQEFRVEIDGCSHDLLGYIDLIDDQNRVVDFKTSRAKPSRGVADDSLQLTGYAAHLVNQGVYPVNVRLDYLTSGKKGVTRTALDSTRDVKDLKTLGRRVDMAAKMVKAGTFMPAMPGSWWCSSTWCGYWNTCPYVNSDRKAKPKQLIQIT